MKKFVLLNGYIEIDNQQFHLKLKNKEVKERGGFITIFLGIFLFYEIMEISNKEEILVNTRDYIHIILQTVGAIVFIYLIYHLIFKKKWSKNNLINEIEKIKVDNDEFETELIICFQNKREVILEFRNLENQINPFLEELKKRNSRIEIKNTN